MRCTAADPIRGLALAALLLHAGAGHAQPHCHILLRPAFSYTVDGAVQFQDISETYGQPANVAWTFGDGDGSSLLDPEHVYAGPGWYTACLTLTTPDGLCSSTYCRQVVVPEQDCGWEISFELTGTTTNTANFLESSALASAAEWYWEFGDGSHSTEPTPSHMWALPGLHYVTLVRTDGICAGSAGRWIEVDGNATTCGPGFFANFTEVYAENDQVLFHPEYTITSGGQPVGNIWSYGDGTVDTAWVGMHTYADPGMYQVCMLSPVFDPTALDSCFAYVCRTIMVFAAVGIGEQPTAGELRAWPVPFGPMLYVEFSAPASGPVSLRLLDPLGRPVASARSMAPGTAVLDTGHLAPGAYILAAEMNDGVFLRRVVRE